MRKHMKLLAAVAGVSLLALTIAGNLPAKGPKPQSAMYTIQGPVCSGDDDYNAGRWTCVVEGTNPVEIGVNVTGWVEVPDGLQVSKDVLCDGIAPNCAPILLDGTYWGRARLLDHRFDFEFDVTDRTPCKLITWDTTFPLTTEYCRYGLVFVEEVPVEGGVAFSEFRFFDYTQGNSLTDPNNLRGSGPVPEWCEDVTNPLCQFSVQLLFPSDEPGGEPCVGPLPKGARCNNDFDCCSGKCAGKTCR